MTTRAKIQWLAATVTLALLPALASAQPFDHQKCYKIKDSAKFSASVDLFAFQTQFNVDPTCRVKGKAQIFCVPVEKTVNDLIYPAGSDMGPIVMPGQDLTDDRLCYRIKCPAHAAIAPEEVQDQFGKRVIGKFKAYWLCTNAVKTNFTTTTTTLPQGCSQASTGLCTGACPNPDEVCTIFPNGCDCVLPCQSDPTTLQCGGHCPMGQVCDFTTNGDCGCL
jgi:hypothetical protein